MGIKACVWWVYRTFSYRRCSNTGLSEDHLSPWSKAGQVAPSLRLSPRPSAVLALIDHGRASFR